MRRVGPCLSGCWLALCVSTLCVHTANAQNRTTAELVGTVTDPSGAMLPGATVTVTNVGTKATFPITTNQAGYYAVPFLQPGIYSITYSQPGFQTVNRTNVELQLGQNARIDVTLQSDALDDYERVKAWLDRLNRTMIERGVYNTPRMLPDGRTYTIPARRLSDPEIIKAALRLAAGAIEDENKGP